MAVPRLAKLTNSLCQQRLNFAERRSGSVLNSAAAESRPFSAKAAFFVALASALAFAVGTVPRQTWFVDDALIFQNFVRNALFGNGLVYYPGMPVEGYSSPLWVLSLTTLGLLGAKGFMAAKAFGAVCGTLVCAIAGLARARSLLFLALACLVLAFQPALLWWSVSGMETPLTALMVSACAIAVMRGNSILAATFSGLAAITRPEGIIYLMPVLAWITQAEKNRSRVVWLIALALTPALVWQGYRYFEYGALISNSALAKTGMGAGVTWATGFDYLLDTFRCFPAPWMIFFSALPSFLMGPCKPEQKRLASLAILAMFLLAAWFGARFGDWMPHGRMLVPVLPLLVLWALHESSYAEKGWNRLILFGLIAAAMLTAFQQLTDYRPYTRQGQVFRTQWPPQGLPFTQAVQATPWNHFSGKMILRYTVPDDRVFIADVGQSGYLAYDVQVMDQYGLVSRYESEYLSRRHSDADYQEYFRAEKPVLAFVELMEDHFHSKLRLPSLVNSELLADYTVVARMPLPDNHLLLVFVRDDAVRRQPDPARLARWKAASPGLAYSDAVLLSADGPDSTQLK